MSPDEPAMAMTACAMGLQPQVGLERPFFKSPFDGGEEPARIGPVRLGFDHLVGDRLRPIPDEGMVLQLGGSPLVIIPAHFLHSCGNFHVYDPVSKIYYSGDLGASLGQTGREVQDFDAHVRFMEGFHRRYMASGRMMRAWVEMVRGLEIDVIAPQHGAVFVGRELVRRFLDWCAGLECGIDLIADRLKVPAWR